MAYSGYTDNIYMPLLILTFTQQIKAERHGVFQCNHPQRWKTIGSISLLTTHNEVSKKPGRLPIIIHHQFTT